MFTRNNTGTARQRTASRRRDRQLRKAVPLVVAVLAAVLLIGGALWLSGLLGNAQPSSSTSTTTTVPAPAQTFPAAPAPAAGASDQTAANATTTFSVKLPGSARLIAHAGDMHAERLSFRLGQRYALIATQPLTGNLTTLEGWLAFNSVPGQTRTPLRVDGRSGYLLRESGGGQTMLQAVFLHGRETYTIALRGPTGQQAALLAQLKRLVTTITPIASS
jgi:hypothetical protein